MKMFPNFLLLVYTASADVTEVHEATSATSLNEVLMSSGVADWSLSALHFSSLHHETFMP